jgi:ArsR family transcriptional regulator
MEAGSPRNRHPDDRRCIIVVNGGWTKLEHTLQSTNPLSNNSDDISRQELYRRIRDRSLIIVDVLAPEAYRGGHIPGAINLPLAEVEMRARQLLPNQEGEIAVYCGSVT